MQDELDDLRAATASAATTAAGARWMKFNILASERDRARALRSGSRFNLRFKKEVPQGALTADGVFDYMTKWASAGPGPAPRADKPEPPRSGDADLSWLRKGLLREDVTKRLGRPRSEESCKGGDASCRLATYATFGRRRRDHVRRGRGRQVAGRGGAEERRSRGADGSSPRWCLPRLAPWFAASVFVRLCSKNTSPTVGTHPTRGAVEVDRVHDPLSSSRP
jgi:hypothetical protein